MSGNIVTTNLRLNLDNAEDRRAWERLRRMDRTRYKSYSRTVVAALNEFFDRQERLANDPYLETREKEEALRFGHGGARSALRANASANAFRHSDAG